MTYNEQLVSDMLESALLLANSIREVEMERDSISEENQRLRDALINTQLRGIQT